MLLRLRGVGVTVCGSVPLVMDGRTREIIFLPLMRRGGCAETEFGVRIILSNEARELRERVACAGIFA